MPFRPTRLHGVTPQNRGRFPGFDVLDSVPEWDDVTAGVVLARLAPPERLSFFTPAEEAVAGPLVDLLMAQDGDPRIPVLALVDARLAVGDTDGWHYDDMPEDGAAWRVSLRYLDEDAHGEGTDFAALTTGRQAAVVAAVQRRADAGDAWHGLPAGHVWSLWTRYACAAFYSHPWAWNEIGFPGPAYPRGYVNLGIDARERWERGDRVDRDPVPFAERAGLARREHDRLVGRERR